MQLKDLTPRYASLAGAIEAKLGARVERLPTTTGELGYRVGPEDLLTVARTLRDAPEFTDDAWEDRAWETRLHDHYGVPYYW